MRPALFASLKREKPGADLVVSWSGAANLVVKLDRLSGAQDRREALLPLRDLWGVTARADLEFSGEGLLLLGGAKILLQVFAAKL